MATGSGLTFRHGPISCSSTKNMHADRAIMRNHLGWSRSCTNIGPGPVLLPILHDKSRNNQEVGKISSSRWIVYGNGRLAKEIEQNTATLDGRFSPILPRQNITSLTISDAVSATSDVGLVNMEEYSMRIAKYNFQINIGTLKNASLL